MLGLGAMPTTPYLGCIMLCTPIQHSTAMPTVLHRPIFPSKFWKVQDTLSSASKFIWTDFNQGRTIKRARRHNCPTSILLTLNIGLQQTIL